MAISASREIVGFAACSVDRYLHVIHSPRRIFPAHLAIAASPFRLRYFGCLISNRLLPADAYFPMLLSLQRFAFIFAFFDATQTLFCPRFEIGMIAHGSILRISPVINYINTDAVISYKARTRQRRFRIDTGYRYLELIATYPPIPQPLILHGLAKDGNRISHALPLREVDFLAFLIHAAGLLLAMRQRYFFSR
jgi:hypothetical protein